MSTPGLVDRVAETYAGLLHHFGECAVCRSGTVPCPNGQLRRAAWNQAIRPMAKFCGRCGHAIRASEIYEPRQWPTASGPSMPGFAHIGPCPSRRELNAAPGPR